MSITVLGVNGFLGKHVINALTSPEFYPHLNRPVVVITRDISKVDQSNSKVVYKQAAGPAEWDPILKETDVFINLAGASLSIEDTEAALKRNPPKLYIPSQFGADPAPPLERYKIFLYKTKLDHSKAVRALGIKVFDLFNAAFDDDEDSILTKWFGASFDHANNTFTHFGSLDTVFSTTYGVDVGKALAAILAFKKLSEIPDQLHISSNNVTIKDVVARYEKAHSVKIEIKTIPLEEAQAKAKEIGETMTTFDLFPFLIQVQTVSSEGPGRGMCWSREDNEIVNPGEKYFKWTPF